MTLDQFLARLEGVRPEGAGFVARCPAHDDSTASLSVAAGEDGRILLHCHAGCTNPDIVAALDLRMRDLFPERERPAEHSRPIATYVYTDERGIALYRIVRLPPTAREKKPFRTWGAKDKARVLYRLHQLTAAPLDEPILIPEGEKDCDNLAKLGFVATCNPHGACKWLPSYTPHLKGRPVVLLEDNDEPGRKHVEQVGRALSGVAASTRVITFRELPAHSDVSDWLAFGHTVEELRAMVETAPTWEQATAEHPAKREAPTPPRGYDEPPPPDDDDAPSGGAPLPDEDEGKCTPAELGRAYLAGHHVISARGDLFVYRDGCYRPGGEALARAWAQSELGTTARKRDGDELVYWLETERSVEDSRLDAGDLVNVSNGLLDWKRGALRPHSPQDLTTVQLPTDWRADAYHERADRFLSEVLPDGETRAVLEEFLGYCLIPDCRYQRALMLTGEGSNGKSVLLSWVTATLGRDNVGGVKLQDLEHRFRAAEIAGKLANISADLPRTAVEDSGPFKMLATGDRFQIERKFRDPSTFTNRAKLIFSANELPGTKDRSGAFFRRWLIVPFPRRFAEGDPGFDPRLAEKFCSPEGRSYLLRLAVEGARRLVERGHFVDTRATAEARAEYRRQADNIVAWYEEECAFVAGEEWTSKAVAYESYRKWCEAGGQVPVTENILARRLRAIEPRIRQARARVGGDRAYVWLGLAVGAGRSGISGVDQGQKCDDESCTSAPRSGWSGIPLFYTYRGRQESIEGKEVRRVGPNPDHPDHPTEPCETTTGPVARLEAPIPDHPTGYAEIMAAVDLWPVDLRKRWAARTRAIRELRGSTTTIEEAELEAARELEAGGAA